MKDKFHVQRHILNCAYVPVDKKINMLALAYIRILCVFTVLMFMLWKSNGCYPQFSLTRVGASRVFPQYPFAFSTAVDFSRFCKNLKDILQKQLQGYRKHLKLIAKNISTTPQNAKNNRIFYKKTVKKL